MDIENKIAIVTGGALGIGKAIVQHFLERGIQGIFILDVKKEDGKELESELRNKYKNDNIWFIETDVTNSTFEDAFKEAINKCGRIDIVINNAGIADDKNTERMLNINLKGVIKGTHLGLKYMSKRNGGNGGVILNIASIAAFELYYPIPEYTASKAGVVNFVRNIGHSYYYDKSGVSITALCPGYTLTSIARNLSKDVEEILKTMTKPEVMQSTETVAKAVEYVIKHGSSGSVWIITAKNLYKKDFPTLENDPTVELIKENIEDDL